MEVRRLAVDMSVNYKANLVFPSPASLVSSFVVTNGQHIFLFNPSSPKVYEAAPQLRAPAVVADSLSRVIAPARVVSGEARGPVARLCGDLEPLARGPCRLHERQERARLPGEEAGQEDRKQDR